MAIFIQKSIKYIRLPQTNSRIEHTVIQLENGTHIVECYAPPTLLYAAGDLEPLIPPNRQSLLLGDLNARHRLRNNNRGTVAGDYIHNRGFIQLLYTDTPTHYPSNGDTPTFIDIGFNNELNNLSDLVGQVVDDLDDWIRS